MNAYNQLIKDAKEELKERIDLNLKENELDDIEDLGDINDDIHEVADSHVPIYTRDILEVALGNIELASYEPELGPAFSKEKSGSNMIAGAIYEHLTEVLFEYSEELKTKGGAE